LFLQCCFLVAFLDFAGEVAGEKHELASQCKIYSMMGEGLGWIQVTCIPVSE
jgi:hypothetical protein